MADATLERQAFEVFARDEVRDRLLYFVGKPKRRSELLEILHTSKFLEPSVLVPLTAASNVPSRGVAVSAVLAQMRGLGASKNCYGISLLTTLDGRTLPLAEALDECFMNTVETLLFDPVGKLGYFEGGHPNDRFILRSGSSNAL